MDVKVKDLDGKEWMIPEDEAEDVKELHTNEVKEWYDDWESREGGSKGMRKGRKLARKGTRRGLAGDDVTDNRDYIEEVVPQEDDSYVVEGTDSPEEIETESEIIDDDHNVVLLSDEGTEEEFMAESEDGEAELIEEDGGESREGRRKGRKVARRGARRGESEEELEDEELEDIDELEEDMEDREGRRRGRKVSRRGVRRGLRRGDTIDVVTDEEGNTEEVDLPEPDEREGRRRGRKVARRGSRRGSVYGGRSPEHQESIRAAVSVAMKDRRL